MPNKKAQLDLPLGGDEKPEDSVLYCKLKELFESELKKVTERLDSLDSRFKSLENKFSSLERQCEVTAGQIFDLKQDVEVKVARYDSEISTLDTRLTSLQETVEFLKIENNIKEQRDRDRSMRIFNLKVPAKIDSSDLANLLYDKLFKGICKKAVEEGKLKTSVDLVDEHEAVEREQEVERMSGQGQGQGASDQPRRCPRGLPTPADFIEYCHILPGGSTESDNRPPGLGARSPRIPVIIVKFTSRHYKYLVHRYKRSILSSFNSANQSKVFLTDDLTKVNLNCLNRLKDDVNVKDAFILNGKIRFSYVSNPDRKLLVNNPFAETFDKMTSRLQL